MLSALFFGAVFFVFAFVVDIVFLVVCRIFLSYACPRVIVQFCLSFLTFLL